MIKVRPRAAVFAAFVFLGVTTAYSAEPAGKGDGSACGPVRNPNSCPGKCLTTYNNFICGDPKPGQVGKHKKELKQCYKACAASKQPK
jgi:hypothetical protein